MTGIITFIEGNESLHEIVQKRGWAQAERKLARMLDRKPAGGFQWE